MNLSDKAGYLTSSICSRCGGPLPSDWAICQRDGCRETFTERARIVAWLRTRAIHTASISDAFVLRSTADMIERGEHG